MRSFLLAELFSRSHIKVFICEKWKGGWLGWIKMDNLIFHVVENEKGFYRFCFYLFLWRWRNLYSYYLLYISINFSFSSSFFFDICTRIRTKFRKFYCRWWKKGKSWRTIEKHFLWEGLRMYKKNFYLKFLDFFSLLCFVKEIFNMHEVSCYCFWVQFHDLDS